VAAPTAGLHFDQPLLDALQAKGVEFGFVTLHVGAGTFQPVRVENVLEHQMHSEYFEVSNEVVEKIAGISHDVIHEHEEAAELAFILQMIMGVFALLSFFLAYKKSAFARISSILTLVIGLAAFAMVARAGYYGGMIRHPEVNGSAAVVSPALQTGGEEDND
jgi:hypothetical protein